MKPKMKMLIAAAITLFSFAGAYAQEMNAGESAMRSNGKIYVVMAICITILAGLILYLFSVDRKISKLEK